MTDDSKAAVKTTWGDVIPKDVVPIQQPPQAESRPIGDAFQDGVSAKTLVLLSLPWFISTTVMGLAVLAYFLVHPEPAAFTESVLAIIVFGAGGAGGSMTFNRLYKYRITHADSC